MPIKITQKDIHESIESGHLPIPSKTLPFEKNSLTDVVQRFSNANTNLAELYHENSKLSKYNLEGIAGRKIDDLASFKKSIVRAPRNIPLPQVSRSNDNTCAEKGNSKYLQLELLSIFNKLAHDDCTLFYDCELKLVVPDSQVLTYDPSSKSLYLEQKYSTMTVYKTLSESLLIEEDSLQGEESFIMISSSFPRNMSLYGIRGYRRTLLDAGRIGEYIRQELHKLDYDSKMITEFYDREINILIGLDGIERAAILAISLRRTCP